VIVRPSPLEEERKEALGAALFAVYSVWQCEGEVRHLVAQRLGGLTTESRSFC
jgi:error-prone DNA polymerase